MQIKKVNMERYGLRFTPSSEEIKFMNETLRKGLRTYKYYPENRRLPIKKGTRIDCETTLEKEHPNARGGNFITSISLKPSATITQDLIERLIETINQDTGLNFQSNEDHITLTPSGLHYFTDDWEYQEGWLSFFNNGNEPVQRYRVRIEFVGNPTETQKSELLEIGDELYVPKKEMPNTRGREYWTTFDPHAIFGTFGNNGFSIRGEGGTYPKMAVDKTFEGDISNQSERTIKTFFYQVKDYLLESKIPEECRGTKDKPYGEELYEVRGIDLHQTIASSTLREMNDDAIKLGVAFFQPFGKIKIAQNGNYPQRYLDTILIESNQFFPF